jgi:hypothetical protein
MALIDPFTRYKPMPLSRHRRGRMPSFRTIVIFSVLLLGALASKTFLMNQYNYLKGLKHWRNGNLELAKMEFNKVLSRTKGDAKAVDGLGLVEMKPGTCRKPRNFTTKP